MRAGKPVRDDTINGIVEAPELLSVQAGALLCLLDDDVRADARASLIRRWPELARVVARPTSQRFDTGHPATALCDQLRARLPVGAERWSAFLNSAVDGNCTPPEIAFALMLVTRGGLTEEDVGGLATGLRDSGTVFDYRPLVRPRRLVRRYPTGGVSEKIALILPALFSELALHYPISSTFLVAPSLGFTGGTWDKLSAIDGFQFPDPGDATDRILRDTHVAMCVAGPMLAPADRMLYEIRSLTGTVESDSLIAASVASKQGALPCDFLALDVRYGAGAFLRDQEHAKSVAAMITRILGAWRIPSEAVFTDAAWPGGIAIGNAIEVAEAVAVMVPGSAGPWSKRFLELQWDLVLGFLRTIMRAEFGVTVADEAVGMAHAMRHDGRLGASFARLLCAHGVPEVRAGELLQAPIPTLFGSSTSVEVLAPGSGDVTAIDQRRLGRIVNMTLGGGGNGFGGTRNLRAGILLRAAARSTVSRNDVLLEVVGCTDAQLPPELHAELVSCISIGDSNAAPIESPSRKQLK
jgi:thymidine phosphorylase